MLSKNLYGRIHRGGGGLGPYYANRRLGMFMNPDIVSKVAPAFMGPTLYGAGKMAYKYLTGSNQGNPSQKIRQNRHGAQLRLKKVKSNRMKKQKVKKDIAGNIVKLNNKLANITKEIDQSTGKMTYRQYVAQRLLSSTNQQVATFYPVNDTPTIESALANCKFFDPSNPATLITGSLASGTYQKNVLLKKSFLSVELRNNYQVDIDYKIYECTVKDDTDSDPLNAWQSAIADGGNASAYTDPNQYPTDYDLVNDLWKLKISSRGSLSPGKTVVASCGTKNVEYSPSTVDSHALDYQHEYKTLGFLIVIQGGLSHDSAVDQQGLTQAGVDIMIRRNYIVEYNAGVNIKYIHIVNSLDTPTNGFVQSQKPVSDNIAYSVS